MEGHNPMSENVIAALVLLALNTSLAPAGEIHVLAAVAVKDPLDRFAQAFTRTTGHKVDIGYSLTGPILADIKAGKPADAIVLPEPGKVALVGAGLLDKPVPVAASLAGVGVRPTHQRRTCNSGVQGPAARANSNLLHRPQERWRVRPVLRPGACRDRHGRRSGPQGGAGAEQPSRRREGGEG